MANLTQVFLEGIEQLNLYYSKYLPHIVIVSYDTFLFHDTIENNLRFVKLTATEAEIKSACKKASIEEFIKYQTRVGLLGDRLSAGEKQRIGPVRAFYPIVL